MSSLERELDAARAEIARLQQSLLAESKLHAEAEAEKDAEITALWQTIGLLTTLTRNVDCGLPLEQLGPAIYREVFDEITALREAVRWLDRNPGRTALRMPDGALGAYLRALEEEER